MNRRWVALGIAAVVAVAAADLPAQGGDILPALARPVAPMAAMPAPSWRSWWRANRGVVAPERAAPQAAAVLWDGWRRFAAGEHDVATALRGVAARAVTVGEALRDLTSDGDAATLAVLRLGQTGDVAAVGFLESLLLDDAAGRTLVGSRAVPAECRAAAALALGLVGDRTAFGALRRILADEPVDDDTLEAAMLLALGLSTDQREATGLCGYLQNGRGGATAREAAATSLGRHSARDAAARACLATCAASHADAAARGAAGVAWLAGAGADGWMGDGARRRAAEAADPTTRALSRLWVAARGDWSAAAELVASDAAATAAGVPRDGYLALGLAVRARRDPKCIPVLHRAADVLGSAGAGVDVLRAVLDATARDAHGRGLNGRRAPPEAEPSASARLLAGTAGFVESPALRHVLDLLARTVR